MTYRIAVTESSPHTVLELRRRVRADYAGDDVAAGMRELYALAERTGLVPAGPPATTYHGEFGPGRTATAEFTLPVTAGPVGDVAERISLRQTEPTLFAYTTHRGDYHRIGDAYRALLDWVDGGQLRRIGPPTEVYLVAPDEAVHPHDLVTEIRVPVVTTELTTRVTAPFGETVLQVRKALAEQGFGVLTEIDARAVLQEKLGVAMEDYRILGACHPMLAHRALEVDRRVGLLLPCNVTVRATDRGTVVDAVDPTLLLDRTESAAELAPIAREAKARLATALEAVEKSTLPAD